MSDDKKEPQVLMTSDIYPQIAKILGLGDSMCDQELLITLKAGDMVRVERKGFLRK